jgi:signal transduction histidine kinase
MAGRLSHELRTPVTIVRSSLENLNADELSDQQAIYVERAYSGIGRLTNILNKMSEARRLEESLDEEEVISFNLAEVVKGCVQGYEIAFPDYEFNTSIEADPIQVTGIPELIAQLLDKLISNAVEFSKPGEAIKVRLTGDKKQAVLRVINCGVELPRDSEDQLFDSMLSIRDSDVKDDADHLGLGLYIARVITEFHGGTIHAANREDTRGVIITVTIPLMRITSKLR